MGFPFRGCISRNIICHHFPPLLSPLLRQLRELRIHFSWMRIWLFIVMESDPSNIRRPNKRFDFAINWYSRYHWKIYTVLVGTYLCSVIWYIGVLTKSVVQKPLRSRLHKNNNDGTYCCPAALGRVRTCSSVSRGRQAQPSWSLPSQDSPMRQVIPPWDR